MTVFSVISFISLVKQVFFKTKSQNQLASTKPYNKHCRECDTSSIAKCALSVYNFQDPSKPILGEI